jgi:Protein of unknown function (DUF3108)
MMLHWKQYFTAGLALSCAFLFTSPPASADLVYAQRTNERSDAAGSSVALAAAPPFEVGEELVYLAEFSRALLKRVDIADFRFSVSREPSLPEVSERELVPDNGRHSYLLKLNGTVTSRGFFTKLFNLHFREEIESTVESAPFRVRRTRKTDEQGKRERTSETTYDHGTVHWVERDPKNPANGVREASARFEGQVQDLLSAIYYLRTQPLEPGKTFVVTVSDSGRVYQVPVRVVEKKRMKTALGRIEAVRADADVFGADGMIPSEGSFWIWFTNDHRHIPVSARIKNEYGTFDITLRKVIQTPAPGNLQPAPMRSKR